MILLNPIGSKIESDPQGPSSFLYSGYQVSFLGVKWPGCGADHLPILALVSTMDRAICLVPSLPSWNVTGQPLCCSYLPHTGDTEFEINTVIMKCVLDLQPYFSLELIRCMDYIGSYDFF